MSVNIRENGQLVKVAGKIPGSFATYNADQFEMTGPEKKFSIREKIITQIQNNTEDIGNMNARLSDNEDNGFLDGGNLAKLEQGGIDLSNGKETDSTTRCRTNYIPIVPNVEYYTDQTNWSIRNGCIYDANMNFISYNAFPDANGKFITEVSNARYLRLIYSHNNTSENCYPTDYPYQFNKDSLKKYHPYAESNVTLTTKLSESADYLKSKNIFNPYTLSAGSIDENDGKTIDTGNSGYYHTDYIEVSKGTYSINNTFYVRIFYYDANYNFLSTNTIAPTVHSFNVPTNTSYIRMHGTEFKSDKFKQLEKGNICTDYVPYADSNVTLTGKIADAESLGFVSNNLFNVNSRRTSAGGGASFSNVTPSGFSLIDTSAVSYSYGAFYVADLKLEVGKQYTITTDATITAGIARISIIKSNDDNIVGTSSISASGRLSLTFTLTSEAHRLVFWNTYGTSAIGNVRFENIRINEGGSDKGYLPYTKSNVQLSNEIANLGDEWNSIKAYKVGEFTIYNNTLWKCKANNTNVAPTNGTYWRACKIATELSHEKIDTQSMEVPANSVGDFTFNFAQTYDEVPFVTITRKDKSTGVYYGNVEVTMNDITRTYVKLHVYNNSAYTVYPTCNLLITRV